MRKLVVTRADNNIKGMTDITFPIIKRFCFLYFKKVYLLVPSKQHEE